MPRVFITNDAGLDFTKAATFGELVVLAEGKVDPFRPHVVQKSIEDKLDDMQFNANEDFILPAGSVLSVAFAFAFLALHADNGQFEEGRVNVRLLLFDAKTRDYFQRTVAI